MAALKNLKHELFAQAIARGESGRQAYRAAGYVVTDEAGDAAASRLLRNGKVSDRISALRQRSDESNKTVLTKVWVIEETIALMKEARQNSAYGPAAKCMELLAREVNAFVQKTEIGKPGDFTDLSDEEIIDRIHDITGEIRGSRKASGRVRTQGGPTTLQ